jgi:hypothetical protein
MIYAYGLFWSADEVTWNPGTGSPLQLLGHFGEINPGLRVVDFRTQSGIYILYGNLGAYYVGLTQNLGTRLRTHRHDDHEGKWHTFSWFGFKRVLAGRDESSFNRLGDIAQTIPISPRIAIRYVEAILIKAMNVQNTNDMKIPNAKMWLQVKRNEQEKYLNRIL